MHIRGCIVTLGLVVSSVLINSAASQNVYRDYAELKLTGERVQVSADAPRPLNQALNAVAEFYGWVLDYEDPVYDRAESVDVAVEAWRKQHPNEPGLLVPSGGAFDVDLGPTYVTPNQQLILDRIIAQYNNSKNPGSFVIKKTSLGRTAIVGHSGKSSSPVSALLDNELKVDSTALDGLTAFSDLTKKCTNSEHVPITIGIIPVNTLSRTTIPGEARTVSCRERLGIILQAMHTSLTYSLLYDPGGSNYVLSVVPAHHIVRDENGHTKLVQIPASN